MGHTQRPIIRRAISLTAGFAFRINTASPTTVNTRNELLIKQFRRIATRYEKLARNYLSFLNLLCTYIWIA
jgi:transposase